MSGAASGSGSSVAKEMFGASESLQSRVSRIHSIVIRLYDIIHMLEVVHSSRSYQPPLLLSQQLQLATKPIPCVYWMSMDGD